MVGVQMCGHMGGLELSLAQQSPWNDMWPKTKTLKYAHGLRGEGWACSLVSVT